jgi:hypothetical protein
MVDVCKQVIQLMHLHGEDLSLKKRMFNKPLVSRISHKLCHASIGVLFEWMQES